MKLSTLVTALAVVGIFTIADAHSGNNDPAAIHACVGINSKIVRIVGVGGTCITGPAAVAETPLHWGIQGPPGTNGVNGLNGTNGTNGTDGLNGTNGTNGIDGTSATRANGPCFDNTNRYVNCGNGTVTDTVTGLIWLRSAACLGSADWAAANAAAAAVADGQCGLTDGSSAGDWRLPTRDEWSATTARAQSLGCTSASGNAPALTDDAGTGCISALYPGPSSFGTVIALPFWSSTTEENSPRIAWDVDLATGTVRSFLGPQTTYKDTSRLAWPVRGGAR